MAWADIEDFYLTKPDNCSAMWIVVDGNAQKLCRFSSRRESKKTIAETEKLMNIVLQQATNAICSAWGFKGARECDWPAEYRYVAHDRLMRGRQGWIVVWNLLMLVFFLICGPRMVASFASLGPGLSAGLVMSMLLLYSYGPVMISAGKPSRRLLSQHVGDKIIVDHVGIKLIAPSSTVSIPWPEVADYYIESSMSITDGNSTRYLVKGQSDVIEFTSQIDEDAGLRQAIKKFSVNAAASEWRSRSSLEKSDNRFVVSSEEAGRKVFTYRNRTSRAYAILGLVFVLPPIAGILIMPYTGAAWSTLTASIWIGIVGLVGTIYFWLVYRRSRIVLDDEGITQVDVFVTRRLLWEEVQGFGLKKGYDYTYVIEGKRRSLQFTESINDAEVLKKMIGKRLEERDAAQVKREKPID